MRINKEIFFKCKNISIDGAVMEKTEKGVVIPLNAGWRDLGSWSEVWKSSEKDKNGNSINGNIILKNCSDNFIHSESRLVAAIGLKDLVIVETLDAILVLNKDHSQKVKELVEELNNKNQPEGIEHKKYLGLGFFIQYWLKI